MRPALRSILSAGVVAVGVATSAHAVDTPRQSYEHYVTCTSTMMAVQTQVPPDKGAKINEMLSTMRDKAIAAGAAVSTPPERTSARIDQGRDRLLAELRQPDAAKAKAAQGEIGRAFLGCSFAELEKTIAARGTRPAASPGK